MKYLKEIILFLAKPLLIGICGVISLQLFDPFFPLLLESMHPFHFGNWMYLYYSPIKSIIVFTLCVLFGTPSIFIIDRWLFNYSSRHIFGGAITATIAWATMDSTISSTGNIFTSPWGINWHLALFFAAFGTTTGALYALLLKALEKLKKDQQHHSNDTKNLNKTHKTLTTQKKSR